MKGSSQYKLPFEIFLEGVKIDIIKGSLNGILEITYFDKVNYNFVNGYNLFKDCLWPVVI